MPYEPAVITADQQNDLTDYEAMYDSDGSVMDLNVHDPTDTVSDDLGNNHFDVASQQDTERRTQKP